MKKGIDISKYQKGLQLSKIKDEIDFVIVRAGYTGWGDAKSKAKDECFEDFYSQAKNLGIPVGCYYFTIARSYQDGVDEANWLYENCLKGKSFEYPIYIDVENDSGNKQWLRKAGKDATTEGIKGFCETLENKGYYVGIYASDISGFKDMMDADKLTMYDKWVARYGKEPSYITSYGMWQTTSEKRISGYNGNLDYNESYKDYPEIMKANNLNNVNGNVVIKKSNEELANEVINGLWGNGEDRKNKLTSAGYDYQAVQDIVNSKLNVKKETATYYQVKKGDNLTKIAKKYNTTINKIMRLNPSIKNANVIYTGQTIRVK